MGLSLPFQKEAVLTAAHLPPQSNLDLSSARSGRQGLWTTGVIPVFNLAPSISCDPNDGHLIPTPRHMDTIKKAFKFPHLDLQWAASPNWSLKKL